MVRALLSSALLLLAGCARGASPTSAAAAEAQPHDALAVADVEIEELAEALPERGQVVAHEWGTFTARVDERGNLHTWTARDRVEPLPKFVLESWMTPAKQQAKGTVRMETPVLYFYADEPRELAVRVEFPGGFLTEWYPSATHDDTVELASLSWPVVKLLPGENPAYPVDGESHYYAARGTDATALEVEVGGAIEYEKLLFYRGVGSFALPLAARPTKLGLELTTSQPLAGVIVFRRSGDQLGFARLDTLSEPQELPLPQLDAKLEDLVAAMRELLVAQGLYVREADAMIETWRALWFEDGLRVLYMVPRELTDQTLPLRIEPSPDELVRVLVGRLDLPGG